MRIVFLAPVILAACASTAASTASSDAVLANALAGRTAGAPVRCVRQDLLPEGPQVIDDHTILYRAGANRVWRNTLPEACQSLRPYSKLVVERLTDRLCRNDVIRPFTPAGGLPGAPCRLGDFVPYDKTGG